MRVGTDDMYGGPLEDKYDLYAALAYNDVEVSAKPKKIHLELTGENDGAEWHWLVELENGSFAYIHGGCDYTGWGCQSSAEAHEAEDLPGALVLVDEATRAVFSEMLEKGETVHENRYSW